MTRNAIPIVVALAIVAGLFLIWGPKKPDAVAPDVPIATQAPEARNEPLPQANPQFSKFVSTKAEPPKAPERPQPSDIVTYEVKDGFGVVQGDMIIGTPEEQNTDKRGLYQMPIPQYWDKPEIPFVIDPDVPRPDEIRAAMKHIQDTTGVKFIPYDNQPDGIVFQKGKEHCLSPLGRLGGLQPIRLTKECEWPEITHEIMHTFGFIHEHSRSDRDEYLNVLWDNIDPKFISQFEILSDPFLGPLKDTTFNYTSIMLYGKNFFAKTKGLITLQSRTREDIRPAQGLSQVDIDRVRKMFRLD